MATPEKIAQYRNAQGFTGIVVKDDADAADGTLLGGHIVHAGMINPPGASTAAAGANAGNAVALPSATSSVYPVTAADGTTGVKLANAEKVSGKVVFVANLVSTAVLKVYPPAGGTINGAAADAAFSTVSGKGAILICLSGSGNTWAGF
tara:strand:+ start:156 stop:602 length:447 start_codon:yes stop_codon:yes gene_type:complete